MVLSPLSERSWAHHRPSGSACVALSVSDLPVLLTPALREAP